MSFGYSNILDFDSCERQPEDDHDEKTRLHKKLINCTCKLVHANVILLSSDRETFGRGGESGYMCQPDIFLELGRMISKNNTIRRHVHPSCPENNGGGQPGILAAREKTLNFFRLRHKIVHIFPLEITFLL